MKKIYYILLFMFGVCAMQSCTDSDNNTEIAGTIVLENEPEVEVSSKQKEIGIRFTSDTFWRMWCDQPWCRLSANEGEAGDQHITAKVAENNAFNDREALILIKAGSTLQEMRIKQTQKGAIVVAEKEYVVESGSSILNFKVESNIDYYVETTENWIVQTPDSRELSSRTLSFLISPNEGYDDRVGYIILKGKGVEQQIKVSQAQKDALLTAKNDYYVDSNEQALTFDVQTNVDFKVKTDVEWIKRAPNTKGLTAKKLRFIISKNEGYDAREGLITITNGTLSQVIKVTQAQQDALIISKHEYTFDDEENFLNVQVSSNVSFDVLCDQDWIVEMPNTKGLKDYPVRFRILANNTPDQRVGMIRFTNGKLTQELKITQLQHDMIVVAQKSYNVTNEANTLNFEVKANTDYHVKTNVSWIKMRANTKGLVAKTLSFDIEENKGTDSRYGYITLYNDYLNQRIEVVQAPKDAIVISKKEYLLDSGTTTLNFNVNANVQFTVNSNVNWMHETTTSRSMQEYPVSIRVDENNGYDDRTGIITIKGGDVVQEIKIVQKQHNAIILAKDEYNIDFKATRLEFKIRTNIKVSVRINESWIKQVAETKGLSDVSLAFDIEENSGYYSREGYVYIFGDGVEQNIKIIQEAKDRTKRISITHHLKEFTVPVFEGRWVNGTVTWGDNRGNDYESGLTHIYNTSGKYTVVIEMRDVHKVTIPKVRDIDLIDFTKF